MAQKSDFFKSISGDRDLSADRFAERFRDFLVEGVFVDNGSALSTELQVSALGGLSVGINLGTAAIQGYFYKIYSSTESLVLSAGDPTNDRIDRIILELNINDVQRDITVKVLEGTPAGTPAAPTLTQDLTVSGIYQISLAQISVIANASSIAGGDITDERSDSSVCGLADINLNISTIGERVVIDDAGFTTLTGTDSQTLFDDIDDIVTGTTTGEQNKLVRTGTNGIITTGTSGLISNGIISCVGELKLLKGSQNYNFTDRATALALQGQSSATAMTFELFTKDGDGTDNINFNLYGKGSPTDITTSESITTRYNTSGQYEIYTAKTGTGTLRPIVLYTEGNTNQLKLNTNGSVSMSNNLDVTGGLTAEGALLVKASSQIQSAVDVELRIQKDGQGATVLRRDDNYAWFLSESGGGSGFRDIKFGYQTSTASTPIETGHLDENGNLDITGGLTASGASTIDVDSTTAFTVKKTTTTYFNVDTTNGEVDILCDANVTATSHSAFKVQDDSSIKYLSIDTDSYSVSTSFVNVTDSYTRGAMAIVTGKDDSGATTFLDVVAFGNQAVTVLHSVTLVGSPATRSYAVSSGLQVKMDSGTITYDVTCQTIG